MLSDSFPDASYIHIVRDCRDVAVSWWYHIKRVAPPEAPPPDFNLLCSETGRTWREYVEGVHGLVKARNLRFHELRYEDLLAQPEAETRKILDFLSASSSTRLVQESVEAARFDRMNGGRKRGKEDTSSFFRKGTAGDWRNHMNEAQEQQLVRNAQPVMSQYGYL